MRKWNTRPKEPSFDYEEYFASGEYASESTARLEVENVKLREYMSTIQAHLRNGDPKKAEEVINKFIKGE